MNKRSAKESAFIEIVQSCSGIINSLCSVFYSDQHERKDARQDIMIQLWRSFDNFKGRSSINTWVYKLSLNTLIKRKRNHHKRYIIGLDEMAQQPITKMSTYSDDDIQMLYNMMTDLDPLDKGIMILYIEGYKYNEIGDILSLSTTNVSSKINRIKKRLNKVYKSTEV